MTVLQTMRAGGLDSPPAFCFTDAAMNDATVRVRSRHTNRSRTYRASSPAVIARRLRLALADAAKGAQSHQSATARKSHPMVWLGLLSTASATLEIPTPTPWRQPATAPERASWERGAAFARLIDKVPGALLAVYLDTLRLTGNRTSAALELSRTRPNFARTSTLAATDANACAVISLAVVTGARYEDAAAAAELLAGRKHREGTHTTHIAAPRSGFTGRSVLGTTFRDLGHRMTLGAFARAHPVGKFLICTAGHALALVDGVLHDTAATGLRSRVRWAWQATPTVPGEHGTEIAI